jgi:hypothetical protein
VFADNLQPVIPRRRALPTALILGAVVLGGTACSTPPPARLVALEMIATLDQPDEVKACMTAKVEAMSEEEVAAIAAADQLTLDGFSADLAGCL